ncbi:hypothetical protein [Lewinella sp. IMCC34191]|uniref:hypothetical protein n=1 Tax=Lewinella sp. IMCC34191 TaxID=2259172 RepID=UPI001300338A|nr:hypothetical protein [Lewinella sp. IMCC34191]
MKFPLGVLFFLLTANLSYGQGYQDALRYSFISPQGTARFAGTGGSLTPMGVDITTLHTNPAGIGWNRYNLAEITPGFNFTGSDALLVDDTEGGRVNDAAATFTLPSVGLLLAGNTRSVNMSTLNFGISLTRIADFNQQLPFDGRTTGSLIDRYVEDANDRISDPFGSDLLFQIDPLFEDDKGIFSEFDFDENIGKTIRRQGLYDRRGSMYEVGLGFGGNFKEKVLWGLSIGIPFLSYDEVFDYDEIDDEDQVTRFEDLSFDRNLGNRGTGFNLKAGVIVLPTEKTRVSLAIHTPTFWTVEETFSTRLTYNFIEGNTASGGSATSDLATYTYNLRTPWRFMAGVGALIGERGFISLDADYSDYAGNTVSFDDFAGSDPVTEATNEDIDALLGSSFGLRGGGELNLKPFQVRAGIGYRQVPYADYIDGEDSGIFSYSAGLGYSRGKFFADMAAQVEQYSGVEFPYQTFTVPGQTVEYDRSRVSVLLTVGFRGFSSGF